MIKLEVINAERDDLHDFAEQFLNHVSFLEMNSLCKPVSDCGPVQGAVLHRDGAFQVEFINFAPGMEIPSHCHPGTDSIEFAIAGSASLVVDGFDPFMGMSEKSAMRSAKGKGLRIPPLAYHSGKVSSAGAMILSFQKWDKPITHIGFNWVGEYSCDSHKKSGDDYANGS